MPREASRSGEPWVVRDGLSTVHIHRRGGVTEQEAQGAVPAALMHSKLERWLRTSPDRLRAVYEGLGGRWPWSLTSLERPVHEQRVLSRLADAFESGSLVALVEKRQLLVDQMLETEEPEEEPLDWTPPPPAPSKPAPVESTMDAAAQARTLREAARDGVPFCEECEKRKQQSAAA
jgi:hypothetical protein